MMAIKIKLIFEWIHLLFYGVFCALATSIFGILPLTVLTFSTPSWAQDDDWLDEGGDDDSSERSSDEEVEINLDEDPDEESIDGRSNSTGDGLYLGEEYETQQFREEVKMMQTSIESLRKN